jgi:hypothetical protein
MNIKILKPIAIGALIGAVLYSAPFFLFRGLFFFLVIGFIIRYFFWDRRGWSSRWYRHDDINPAFADTIRRMSDEEYEAFKKKFDQHRMSEKETKSE